MYRTYIVTDLSTFSRKPNESTNNVPIRNTIYTVVNVTSSVIYSPSIPVMQILLLHTVHNICVPIRCTYTHWLRCKYLLVPLIIEDYINLVINTRKQTGTHIENL